MSVSSSELRSENAAHKRMWKKLFDEKIGENDFARSFTIFFLITLTAITLNLLVYFFPCFAPAHAQEVADIMRRRNMDIKAVSLFDVHHAAENNLQNMSQAIGDQISLPAQAPVTVVPNLSEDGVKKLSELRDLAEKLADTPLPFGIGGVIDRPVIYLNIINFICIGVLMVRQFQIPNGQTRLPFCRTYLLQSLGLGLLYYVVFAVPPTFMRYIYAYNYDLGRRTYSFYDFDINLPAFFFCQFEFFVIGFMLGCIWLSWGHCLRTWQTHFETPPARKPKDLMPIQTRVEEVTRLFQEWQGNSLLLAGAFLPWSYFDWIYTHFSEGSDTRYAYMALIDHLVWIGTWFLISLPLIEALTQWQKFKTQIFFAIHSGHSQIDAKLLAELDPVSPAQRLAAIIAAVASFILPIFGILQH